MNTIYDYVGVVLAGIGLLGLMDIIPLLGMA